MNSLLVITHCASNGLPQQGSLIGEKLRQGGVEVRILGTAKSGWGRLLEVVSYSFFLVPRYNVVLVDLFGLRAFVYESVAILCARVWRKRIVVVLRNGMMPEFFKRWPRWNRFILSKPDLVLVPHSFLKEQLSPQGVRIDGTIPNCIESNHYRFRERSHLAPRFLYIRGMHPIYNAPMVLRAFALIQRQYRDALLTMAGREGQDSDYCRSLVHSLKLRNVEFVGLIPKNEIPALADKHDIYLQTNRIDNMPVSVIEMWACGLPIVATDVGGITYLIRNRIDGMLVASEDCQAMAHACFELLYNSELAKKLSCNGRLRASELSWERIQPMWEKALFLDRQTSTKNHRDSHALQSVHGVGFGNHEQPEVDD